MMEGSENYSRFDNITKSAGSSAPARWNPTKEQISVLENLYRQGIRTPNADQIQQITSRLRAFGHIEGKNVFYWFQNHKARQRQKQKQESMAYFQRLLHNKATSLHHHHHPPAVLPPLPCPNVCSTPHYLPQSELGFCPQYPTVMLPMGGEFKRTSRSEKIDSPKAYPRTDYEFAVPQGNNTVNPKITNQETLPLFPLHPTGILQGREKPLHSLVSSSTAATVKEAISPCDDQTAASNCGLGYAGKPFFNFLSGDQYPCERDKN